MSFRPGHDTAEGDDSPVVALADLLSACVTRERPTSERTVAALLAELAASRPDPVVLAAAVGAAWAAFPEVRVRPDAETLDACLDCARALSRAEGPEAEVVLGASTIGLLVDRRLSDRSA